MEILQAISDIGLLREINEDYAFCCNHPENSQIKLLILADGMGGKSQGDLASQEVGAAMEAWFYQENVEVLAGIDKVEKRLEKRIKEVNTYLIQKYGANFLGTTLTLAIVGLSKTLFYNIGDSRGYIYKDRKLTQITEDDSGVWNFYKNLDISKDDLRFFPTNNLITACVGLNDEFCKGRAYIVNNCDYQAILLVTDGVTDLMADADIKRILEYKEKKKILKRIVDTAVHKDLKLHVPMRLKNKYSTKFSVPRHGRDNASGVIYIKD